jgi:FAD/FMN-containing dehydrogenase
MGYAAAIVRTATVTVRKFPIPRRAVIAGGLSAGALACSPLRKAPQTVARPIVNDVTLLNPVEVSRIETPRVTDDIRRLVGAWTGPISIGGGCYSMGGQIAAPNSLHFDMRHFNRAVHLDVDRKIVRVQTGMRWRDLQTLIDPHGLAVKIMQSYSNFTIGGALSVNAHGRYVGLGPIVHSVRRLQLVLSGGATIEASPRENADLFYGAIGGYGGLGVVTEVELDLLPNARIERQVAYMSLDRYPAFFHDTVLGGSDAVLHNADLEPPDLNRVTAITWRRTNKAVTVAERLLPIGKSYSLDAAEVRALTQLPAAHFLRRAIVDPISYNTEVVVWQNHEASLDVSSLGTIGRRGSTYALQEYFVPRAKVEEFVGRMSRVLRENDVNALNVSIRHSPADGVTAMAWAREEVFSLVLYYWQRTSPEAVTHVGNWTRQLIDAALALGGTYYLPYQLHATREQFLRAYPQAMGFFKLKAEIDPHHQFRNKLWTKYGPSA